MKLQKQISRKLGDVIYPKWVLVLPQDKVMEAKLKEGDELEAVVKNGKITLVPKKTTK